MAPRDSLGESGGDAEPSIPGLHRLLVEHSADVLVLTSAGVLRWITPEVRDLIGWTAGDLVGRTTEHLWHPEDRESAMGLLHGDGTSGTTERGVFRLRAKDERYRWIEASVRPYSLDHAAAGTVGTLRDVTAQVEAAGLRAEAEERFHLAMENSAIGMCLISPEGEFLLVNAALCRILGRDAEDLLACTWQELTHPEDLRVDQDLVDDVLAGRKETYRLLKRYLRPDGALVWGDLSVSCVRAGSGAVRYFISQIVDVTERVAAERALEASEARFRLLVENASDVVFRSSTSDRLEWLSPSVTQTAGWLPEELVGTRFTDLVHPDDAPAVRFAQRRLARGRRDALEVRITTRSGAHRWMSVTLAPIFDASGTVVGRTGSWRDIQAEVDAREALRAEEQRYRILAENATDVVVHLGEEGRIRWVAPSVEDALGWTPAELVGTNFRNKIHPDDRLVVDGQPEGLPRDRPTRGVDTVVVRVRDKAGTYVWFSARTAQVFNAGGAPDGLVAGLRNVDGLVRAEREAEEGRRRMKAILDAQIDPHLVLEAVRDGSGAIVDFVAREANAAACSAMGIPHGSVVGSPVRASLLGEIGVWQLDAFRQVTDSGEPLALNDLAQNSQEPDGGGRRYDIRAVRFGDGLSLTWRDVTDRFNTARRLAESEEQFRRLAESSSEVVLLARDGVMQWLSSALATTLGWVPQEWVGRRFEEFTHPDDIGLAQRRSREITAGQARSTRLRLRGADACYHWVEIHAAPFINAHADPDGIVATFHLIDEPAP